MFSLCIDVQYIIYIYVLILHNICKYCSVLWLQGRHFKNVHYYYCYICNSCFCVPDCCVIVCVWVVSENNDRAKYTAKVAHDALPSDIISDTIRRRSRTMGMTREHAERCIEEYKHLYVLKVCGCNEFLLAEVPISQYKVWWDFFIKKFHIHFNS